MIPAVECGIVLEARTMEITTKRCKPLSVFWELVCLTLRRLKGLNFTSLAIRKLDGSDVRHGAALWVVSLAEYTCRHIPS